jgi:hypothetical protein
MFAMMIADIAISIFDNDQSDQFPVWNNYFAVMLSNIRAELHTLLALCLKLVLRFKVARYSL